MTLYCSAAAASWVELDGRIAERHGFVTATSQTSCLGCPLMTKSARGPDPSEEKAAYSVEGLRRAPGSPES